MPASNLPANVSSDLARDIVAMGNGDVIITGYHTQYVGGLPYNDILTIRMDSIGQVVWSTRYDINEEIKFDAGYDIAIDSNGDILVGGMTAIGPAPTTNSKFVIIKYNGISGEIIWDYVEDLSINEDVIFSIFSSESDAIYVTGTSNIGSIYSCVTIKYREAPIAVDELIDDEIRLTVFPNPSKNSLLELKFNISIYKTIDVQIRDILGKVIYSNKSYSIGNEIDLTHVKNGTYILHVKYNSSNYISKIILSD